MGDVGPCELIDGRVVPMRPTSARHGAIESRLAALLRAFLRERGREGHVLVGEVGVITRRGPDRVRGADLAFVSKARLPGDPPDGFLEVAPDLIVEVMSARDAWQDVREKIEEFFALGVDRVWVVEPKLRKVLVFKSQAEFRAFGESDTLEGEGALEGLRVTVSQIFQD
jgi:Uma2 family endonuclease